MLRRLRLRLRLLLLLLLLNLLLLLLNLLLNLLLLLLPLGLKELRQGLAPRVAPGHAHAARRFFIGLLGRVAEAPELIRLSMCCRDVGKAAQVALDVDQRRELAAPPLPRLRNCRPCCRPRGDGGAADQRHTWAGRVRWVPCSCVVVVIVVRGAGCPSSYPLCGRGARRDPPRGVLQVREPLLLLAH